MLRLAARPCPFCQVRPFLAARQQTRLYAQLQRARTVPNAAPRLRAQTGRPPRDKPGKPRPSRMVLSDTVARSPRPSAPGKPARKRQEPFSHLNKTRAPAVLERMRHEREDRGKTRTEDRGKSRTEDRGKSRTEDRGKSRTEDRGKSRTEDRGKSHAGRRREGDKRTSRSGPFHALKMQKSLHEVSYSSRTAIRRKIQQVETFNSLPMLQSIQDAVKDALPGLEYRNPTPAQAVAIPALLGMDGKKRSRGPSKQSGLQSFLLAAETGSGKTLAYLLPTIDAIKREESAEAEEQAREEAEKAAAHESDKRDDIFALEPPSLNKAADPARPRAIILVPSAELVAQVGTVAKSLSHTVKFRAAPISAKNSATVIRNRLFNENGVDIVISTPPLLASIAESNPNILSRVTHLIVDEADSLFDRSFKPSTTEILERTTPSLKKLILCSATIPRFLDKYLAERYPSMNRIVTPNLHAIPRRVQLGVVDVNKDPYRGNKMLACADTIWQIGRANADYDPDEGKEAVPTKRILVFVNEREDTEQVAQYLVKKGIDAIAFHRDTDPSRQAKTLASFTGVENAKGKTNTQDVKSSSAPSPSSSKRQLTNTKVIVTTDLGSRGIDTVSVRYVILYDVPHTTIDFIHRLGRTGRMGRRGRGIVLVGAGDRADVVKEVKDAMFRGEALI